MKKYILGINLPMKSQCHESGVALIDHEGKIIFAMNEERVSRKKLDGDFPELAIDKMFAYTGIKKEEITHVVVPTLSPFKKAWRFAGFLWRERKQRFLKLETYLTLIKLLKRETAQPEIDKKEDNGFKMKYYWQDFIKKRFPEATIAYVDHHIAHVAAAYYKSPWPEALVMSVDGAGNLLSSVIADGEDGYLTMIAKTFIPHSPGSFWGSITKVCGFKSGTRHGGKVTGLAARGNPDKLIDKMRKIIWTEGMRFKVKEEALFDTKNLIPDWGSYKPELMREIIGDATREDIAAAAQQRLEEIVVSVIKEARKVIPHKKIVLAGGVFANVLLNEKILEMPEIEDIFIFPAMSDGGLALGAALQFLAELKQVQGKQLLPQALPNVYLGPDYKKEEIESLLKEKNIKYRKMTEPAREVAKLVNEKKIIALYHGRMEYGPRALGTRSIIYSATDPAVNDWLNKMLNRSEFMPFAPVTLIEHIKECYLGIVDDHIAAKYMTVTYQCTDKMKQQSPACVHVDGTARPQVIKREDNPYYYDILQEYYKISGISTFINTSFNMHEEPIVCSPQDAIRAFFTAKMHYLVMEDYLVSFEENKEQAEKLGE